MKVSKDAQQLARKLHHACITEDGSLDEAMVRKCAKFLIEKKPRNYLQALTHFRKLIAIEVKNRHAIIESAIELSSEETGQLLKSLEDRYGKVTHETHVNPELIGGVKVRIGSDVWDASVKGRLDQISRKLAGRF